MDFPAEVLEEVFSSGGPLLPEEDQPPRRRSSTSHQPVPEEDGKPAAETTATEASSEENAPEEEPAEEPQETPEPQEAPKVSLEQIMNDTVSSVLEEQEDGILEERPPLREVLRHWWEKLTRPRSAAPIPQDTETLWEQPQEPQPEPEPDPEPDMDVAVRREAPLRPLKTPVLVRTAGGGAADGAVRAGRAGAVYPPAVGGIARAAGDHPRRIAAAGTGPVGRVWRSARKQLSQRRITCEAAALLASLVACLGDCVYAALGWQIILITGSSCRWRPSRSSPCCCVCGASCWRRQSQARRLPGLADLGVSRPTTYPTMYGEGDRQETYAPGPASSRERRRASPACI